MEDMEGSSTSTISKFNSDSAALTRQWLYSAAILIALEVFSTVVLISLKLILPFVEYHTFISTEALLVCFKVIFYLHLGELSLPMLPFVAQELWQSVRKDCGGRP